MIVKISLYFNITINSMMKKMQKDYISFTGAYEDERGWNWIAKRQLVQW